MALSSDITEVLSEVGSYYDVLKPDGTTGLCGYADLTPHPEHTTVAIREHFITGTLSSDAPVASGDVLKFINGMKLVVTTLQPEFFENTVIDILFASWVCNVEGKFQRKSDEPTYDANYEPITAGWVDQTPLIPAAQIPVPSARSQYQNVEEYWVMELNHDLVYISDFYDVQSGDRWWVSDSSYWSVEAVSSTLMAGLKVCTLEKDVR